MSGDLSIYFFQKILVTVLVTQAASSTDPELCRYNSDAAYSTSQLSTYNVGPEFIHQLKPSNYSLIRGKNDAPVTRKGCTNCLLLYIFYNFQLSGSLLVLLRVPCSELEKIFQYSLLYLCGLAQPAAWPSFLILVCQIVTIQTISYSTRLFLVHSKSHTEENKKKMYKI